MYKAPYTVYFDGLDNPYNNLKVKYIRDAAQIWADEKNAVILDDNGVRVDIDDIKAVLGW